MRFDFIIVCPPLAPFACFFPYGGILLFQFKCPPPQSRAIKAKQRTGRGEEEGRNGTASV